MAIFGPLTSFHIPLPLVFRGNVPICGDGMPQAKSTQNLLISELVRYDQFVINKIRETSRWGI
jgi:hypothetical protein